MPAKKKTALSPYPPMPGDAAARARRDQTSLARRINEGAWKPDLETTILKHFDPKRRPVLGPLDIGRNMQKNIGTQMSALYQEPFTVTAEEDDESAATMAATLSSGGYFSLAPRNQRNAVTLREAHVRAELTTKGNVVYRLVTPDMIEAECDPENPNRIVKLWEAQPRYRQALQEWVWTWDHFDITDPAQPIYEVLLADLDKRVDLTAEFFTDGAGGYPWVSSDPEIGAIIPYPTYHLSDTGHLYNINEALEVIEGTLNVGSFWTLWGHCFKDNSYKQRYIAGADVGGAQDTGGGTTQGVATDGSSILQLFQHGSDSIMVGEFSASSDPKDMGEALRQYELSLMQNFNMGPGDIESKGPESGYAISLRHTAIRKAQADMMPQFMRADLELMRVTAILLNTQGASVPEDGYTITYNDMEMSIEEERAELEMHVLLATAGLSSQVKLMMKRNPGMSEEGAREELRQNQRDAIEFPVPSVAPTNRGEGQP